MKVIVMRVRTISRIIASGRAIPLSLRIQVKIRFMPASRS
jgi:hypothetical protein